MTVLDSLVQTPAPGSRHLRFRGDLFEVTLTLPERRDGAAWLRTNIGRAAVRRREIIRDVLNKESELRRDWYDIPMVPEGDRRYRVTLPLSQVGHFEAKAYFLAENDPAPIWPPGQNTIINVEPADTCCDNTIYNAFVRQFGPNKAGQGIPTPEKAACIKSLDADGYTVIPRSGTFRDLVRELDFIIGHLGCRYLQLLPIHPTPTTYGRMGRFGSPYAALSFTDVDPALAEFDPKTTPLEQFIELVDAVHARRGKLLMDIAINHTGWAASLHETHPQWLSRDEDGRIEMPGAWGVTWADLTKLDYSHKDLWVYMAEVFLTWCRRGVDGFRCDAGYMIPVPAWRFIVATVRDQYPDTLFFLEGLGGKISVTRDLLNLANLNWAYSELFQNYDRGQIEHYLPGALEIADTDGVMIHFCETHDNNRMAATSAVYARMRTALCALCSRHGGFAFANGVEWLATEKINVHESSSLDWGAEHNQIDLIRKLTTLLKTHPAFGDRTDLRMIQEGEGNGIALLRRHRPTGRRLLVVVNLDHAHSTPLSWRPPEGFGENATDLISGRRVRLGVSGDMRTCLLEPGEFLCLTDDPADLSEIPDAALSERNLLQRFRAKALDVRGVYHDVGDMGGWSPEAAARRLAADPVAFCRDMNPESDESRVVVWRWPADVRRNVMVPPRHFLMVTADRPFRVRLNEGATALWNGESLPVVPDHGSNNGSGDGAVEGFGGRSSDWFALMPPLPTPDRHRQLTLRLSVFEKDACRHAEAPILALADGDGATVRTAFSREALLRRSLLMLGTNGRGGMMRAHAAWGRLESRYDALLAANLSPDFPEDRWVMFTRCRAWVVFQGFSYEIGSDCLDEFRVDSASVGHWRYRIPTGQGADIGFRIRMAMMPGRNAVRIDFHRESDGHVSKRLTDDQPVRLILRPDVEDRNFHETTKAYTGPEHRWPGAVTPMTDGFVFAPDAARRLTVTLSKGAFFPEPEWRYMVHRPLEAERGLDPDSDLFSPGYFQAAITGGETVALTAEIRRDDGPASPAPALLQSEEASDGAVSLETALRRAIAHYIVSRDRLKTVIAGYPWFLDWGRDTLIVVRGLIAGGYLDLSKAILKQFARFEENGTIPNMIRGNDAGNRNTSDAPLWLYVTVRELMAAEGSEAFLKEDVGGRTVGEVLVAMGRSLASGAPNGVGMDPDTGLLFSPAHFTWMDTNHPAGTPRQGYPVEIQALWHDALVTLAKLDPGGNWRALAENVRSMLHDRYFNEERGCFADCLHAVPGVSATRAIADDALRPNQLFAITLGAVTDKAMVRSALDQCTALLVPGAIRSLADRPVAHPIPVVRDGRLLNNPHRPYAGKYAGDEDTRRKPAYHNGTAWTWVFPSFCEAYADHYGEAGKAAARAWLSSGVTLIDDGCVGHVPEILDGDFPHVRRGCDAQAWGVSELLRVWLKLLPR